MALVFRATFIDEVVPEVALAKRTQSEPPKKKFSHNKFDPEREYVAGLQKKAHELKSPKTPRKSQFSPSRSRAGSAKSTSTTCSASTPVAGMSAAWEASFPSSPSSGPCSPAAAQQPTLTERCIRFDVVDAGPVRAGRVPNGTASRGPAPEGLPLPISAGSEAASTCPRERARAPHLSKPHRDLLKKLTFSERVALMLPMVRKHVARMHCTVEVKELLHALKAVASGHQPPSDARRTQLLSALGVLSVRALITAIVKAPDTPDWLKEGLLKDQLDRVRGMDSWVAPGGGH